jgi:hypothetical protein
MEPNTAKRVGSSISGVVEATGADPGGSCGGDFMLKPRATLNKYTNPHIDAL